MASGGFRFEDFLLDPADRLLSRGGAPVELNARYLDALTLLVSEPGRLVSKDRFMDEVWRGVPVTDEALTQCIKTLRRQLGDDAGNPRFIETVPKHGYRFIAPVQAVEPGGPPAVAADPTAEAVTPTVSPWRDFFLLGAAGTLGGGAAGLLGGLFYGFAAAAQPMQGGMGSVSVLLVLLWLTLAAALTGAAGVSFGIAAARFAPGGSGFWPIAGGAAGGLAVGAVAKLLGLDAFNLLLGRSPGDITGGAEGLVLGTAVGIGAWLATRQRRPLSLRRSMAAAGLLGGLAGTVVTLLGGRLMGGSLELLARTFPDSRLRLDQIGALLGETGFGPLSQVVTGALEGALFGACLVGAMVRARRRLSETGLATG